MTVYADPTNRRRHPTERRRTLKTLDDIAQEQRDAEAALLQMLSERGAASTSELLQRLREGGHRFSSGTVRRAAWSLVDRDAARFDAKRRLRLNE